MIEGQRTTEEDITSDTMLLLECIEAAIAEGKDIHELARELRRAIKRRLLREKRERAA